MSDGIEFKVVLEGRRAVVEARNGEARFLDRVDPRSAKCRGELIRRLIDTLPGLEGQADEIDREIIAAVAPNPSASPLGATDGREVLRSEGPMRLAEALIANRFLAEGIPSLRRWRDEWWRYEASAGCYRPMSEEALRVEIYQRFDGVEVVRTIGDREVSVPIVPGVRFAREVATALPACGLLVEGDAPRWLTNLREGDPDPAKFVACRNGLLFIDTGALLPSTPRLFATRALPVTYEPNAPEPTEWLRFLASVWDDDEESIAAICQWFGYFLVGARHLHKILMLIGPPRSGKGVIGRVLRALIGDEHFAAPTLASLSGPFGLEGLLNRSVAFIADARLGSTADVAQITERLLSISGEDAQQIARKHKLSLTATLPTRFAVCSNELPRLGDSSGALASRFIILQMRRSFLGIEDHRLTDRLLGELPAILKWALGGWSDLRDMGRFIQPESGLELVDELADLASPVAAFVRDECALDPNATLSRAALFERWQAWCLATGRKSPGTLATFGRDLNAAFPQITSRRPGARGRDGRRSRVYAGIRLLGPDEVARRLDEDRREADAEVEARSAAARVHAGSR